MQTWQIFLKMMKDSLLLRMLAQEENLIQHGEHTQEIIKRNFFILHKMMNLDIL